MLEEKDDYSLKNLDANMTVSHGNPFKINNAFVQRMHTSHMRQKTVNYINIFNILQGDTSNRPVVIEKGYIDDLESQIDLLKKENEQLSNLNRKLTEDIMTYTYKDTLKEAQYIIEG